LELGRGSRRIRHKKKRGVEKEERKSFFYLGLVEKWKKRISGKKTRREPSKLDSESHKKWGRTKGGKINDREGKKWKEGEGFR